MKTKFKAILALALLMICMSSCVYSLFPIYTKDTLVYLPELEGKWQMGDDPDSYITFSRNASIEASIKVTEPDETQETPESEVTITRNSYSIEFDGDEYIIEDGDTIRDKEKVKAYYEKKFDSALTEFGDAMAKTLEGMGKAFEKISKSPNPLSYSQSSDGYVMTVKDGDEVDEYQAHLAQIGDDIFIDLYASDSKVTDKALGSMVWFPVHMFMKLELDGDQLRLIQFDLEKMNKLFESNLIRMRHENVDGTVLITAQPKEIQKFLDKYSDDESVFDEITTYNKILN